MKNTNTVTMLNSICNIQMNAFIITTADGKIIVMDGGFDHDHVTLLDNLRRITGEEVPHIHAWFLSHPHVDHISCFLQIMEQYPDALTFDRVYYNFPSIQFIKQEEHDPVHSIERFYADLPRFVGKAVIVSAGDQYDIGEAHFECLCSPDAALNHNVVNNASVVWKMTLADKTFLFLGDAGAEEGEKMLAMHGGTDKLKADYVQMAHHGQNGVGKAFYEAVSPTACLWCTPQWLWDNDNGTGFNTHFWKTVTVRGWMDELGVKEHYIMKDGLQEIKL